MAGVQDDDEDAITGINITPLVDIVLVLLIAGALFLAASGGEYDPDVMDPSSPDAPMYEEEYYSED